MASFVAETDDVEALFEKWWSILTNHCGQSRRWIDPNHMVHIEWDRPYVPEGEDPDYVIFRKVRKNRGNPCLTFPTKVF